jgi:creatinine amidohydrolase
MHGASLPWLCGGCVTTLFAEELTAPEFASFVSEPTVGILPVAAIEPHGPHLPLSTDCDIARGHLAALSAHVDAAHDVLILPLQTVGHSVEHSGQPGLFSHEPELLLRIWWDIVMPFHRAGGRRLIVVSSHGGNSETTALFVTRLRARLSMLAVTAGWQRFGQPSGVFPDIELLHGIHGGAVETSLMLHYWPDAVRRERCADFASAALEWDRKTTIMAVHGRTRPAGSPPISTPRARSAMRASPPPKKARPPPATRLPAWRRWSPTSRASISHN